MKRKEIRHDMTVKETVEVLAERNPGALSVLTALVVAEATDCLLHLDDMNMRGPQIWVGFKDHCGQNMDKFIHCVRRRDVSMVDTVNREMLHPGFDHKAVAVGGSAHRYDY